MNNKIITALIYGACGAICGALATYIVLDKKHQKEIDELHESFSNIVGGYTNLLAVQEEKLVIYEGAGIDFNTAKIVYESNKKAAEEADKALNESVEPAEQTTIYSNIYNSEKKKEAENVEERKVTVEDPYLISINSFSEDHEEYKKLNCTFYTEDKVLCETSHGEKIDLGHIGLEALDILESGDSTETIYVRNDYLGVDYEIDIFDSSYTYEVLGEESLEE